MFMKELAVRNRRASTIRDKDGIRGGLGPREIGSIRKADFKQLFNDLREAGTTELVFPNGAGKPLNPANFATRVWQPLRKRAGVSELDMYSLRHSFASLGRTAAESAFNMSRMMGHSRRPLIDQVYAHSLQSGLASAAENVTARALGVRPQLRVIEGGVQRDVRDSLDEVSSRASPKSASF